MRCGKEEIELDFEEVVEVVDQEELYNIVVNKRSEETQHKIDKTKGNYVDGIDTISLKDGKVVITYWWEEDD